MAARAMRGRRPTEVTVMTNRSRAWRRRKARLILGKIKGTKNWVIKQFEEAKPKPGVAAKPRKTARARDLRLAWQLNEDLVDGVAG